MFDERKQVVSLFKSLNKFKKDSKEIMKPLKSEGITLNFAGYTELIELIYYLDEGDLESVFDACKSLLLWREYMSTLLYRINECVTSHENKLLYLIAFIDNDRVNVKLNELIEEEQSKYDDLKYYMESLDTQIKMLRKVYKNIQYRYDELCKEAARIM